MGEEIKLNLGCGIIYKTGYINIDNFDYYVADMICNADNLPFESCSIDRIEACHLLEHFDYAHCRYILSEWLRVLKPHGKLILETPDLEKSFKKFESSNIETKKKTLQWIYGIDSPGMHHKTGFTFKLLSEILEETGFKGITKGDPYTHKYEPGLRIECEKTEDNKKYQFFSIFRREIKQKLSINKSDLLSSLEDNCLVQIKDIFFKDFDKNKRKAIKTIISKSAISNPLISLIFCEKCIEFDFFTKDELKKEINMIRHLIKMDFHKKLVNLWKKSKKEIGKNNVDFIKFLDRLESKILKIIVNSNYDEFTYISHLESEDIKIFNFYVVQLQAMIMSNKGVKEFFKKNYKRALVCFLNSVRLYSDNPIVYWNLAKIGIITSIDKETVSDYYEKSFFLMKDKKMLYDLKKEFKFFINDKSSLISLKPIGELI